MVSPKSRKEQPSRKATMRKQPKGVLNNSLSIHLKVMQFYKNYIYLKILNVLKRVFRLLITTK